ncbi:DNA polymerase I [Tenacibaculum finnmarkense genomovar finnmarkense]|uniref:DNA polymerase I n=1 Tax=Tenacibaculum finnmarkense TaxID=2781243 RepID=UPI001E31FB48|nr:DNA polymerase I [Tenacibaculum finnmarkense]MCD8417188.1 DNA polymerase I [Tenacibaculum finnmarkense genomovar finnmarkense]MCG8185571.1 DNA polymerase I [Tenacibaculum finnmarkense genomovar finnmarkense]MCG8202119.1 DNA polymerase I [Tenacibaculum finnmarkense genomovar finnmarkense]MCG8209593.1 DNA polymerase I [Tenacibaculum finnmarkense genomovar finnmarkense]MCG8212391.1 DNA polymerase I [Tenacibaculum finnmarkense genomovar finnmarkense]
MENQKRLFLLDAFALIFRGYYAFIKNPRINSKGMDVSAILGFTNSMLDVIKRERPDHLAVCFDRGGSVDRRAAFPEYKANRQETPEAIKIAIPYIEAMLKAMNIPVVVKSGYEADDIIGTLAKKAEKAGYKTFMVTPDKDFAQLVSENIFMYRPRFGGGYETWGIAEVQEKFGVERPEQVIDYLGMMGDAVDNIPGLPGVGDKTAKKFLAQYGSMENLLANTADLKGKMKEKVIANAELGILSKELATIMLDVPVDFDQDNFEMCQPNIQATANVLNELEFKRLADTFVRVFTAAVPAKEGEKSSEENTENKKEIKAIPTKDSSGQFDLFATPGTGIVSEETPISGFKNIKNTNHFYQHINSPIARKLLLSKLMQQTAVCFDTETTGLKALEVELIGISFSWEIGKGYYVSFPENQEETKVILKEFSPFFETSIIEKIGHNLKYDLKVLSNYNISVKGKLFDTMIAHYLINPDMRHGMDILAETYLNYQPVPITDLIGKKGKNQLSMRTVEIAKQTEYAVEDADITLQLKEHFTKELETGNVTDLFNDIETPLVSVLTAMEIEGINLNVPFLKELSIDLTNDIERLEKNIYEQAGEEFNIGSPKQLGIVLFENMKLVEKPKKTKTGQYSTAEDVLSFLAKEHQIIRDIQEYRQYKKLKSTYVDALPNEINTKTGRIHTSYAQAVASTGRLSSNNPNLQNIPIRTKRGQEIRKAFIPRNENYVLLAADYSQIELRIIASLSKEETMIEAFKNGEDIHASTASKVFNVPLDEVTREQRSNAKTVNFGIVYGVSAFGLSNQTDLSRKEAKALIDTYYETYPKLKNYMAKQVDFARDNGYVETVLNRRRYLKDINSRNGMVRSGAERNAVNAPIQGSAADIIKLAMINIHKRFEKENFKSKMLLQVHDELVFDAHKDELEIIKPIIKQEMENAFKMEVPLDVEIGIGENWLQAH